MKPDSISAVTTGKFITTESTITDSDESLQQVWSVIKTAFKNRDSVAYLGYPMFAKTGETREAPDIFIADRELGLITIKVLNISLENISEINEQDWIFQGLNMASGNPYEQSEDQLYTILGFCNKERLIRNKIPGTAVLISTKIDQKEWEKKGFGDSPNANSIIFKDALEPKQFIQALTDAPICQAGQTLDAHQWAIALSVVTGGVIHRKKSLVPTVLDKGQQRRVDVINSVRERLYELDLQQSTIGVQIPPGAQRIRGIAGSGKTVLLCQKAVNMHLKHPDWQIALIFFTRSLYDQIIELVDKWMWHHSGGEIGYKDNPEAQEKLKVFPAWGAKKREGFHRFLCQQHDISPMTVKDTDFQQPNEALADISKQLLEKVEIKPLFDAILIDEGQDLVVDPPTLKYKNRQSIYWLAYQVLQPCDPENPEQRRLIWAYDEAQRLANDTIPSAPEIFGKDGTFSRFVSGQYKGGIRKSEVMRRCYRTPAPILVAAHALGMGFLRKEGMVSGITQKQEWDRIGYQVTGDFRKRDSEITIRRSPENSPNPMPQLWQGDLLDFNLYDSREDELQALIKNIKYNLEVDGLKPSQQILVIVLGNYEAQQLETEVATTLQDANIDFFIPSGIRLNQLQPKHPRNNPDTFWHEGGVTVSRVTRAKGNEADMVYVIGLDHVAKNEDEPTLRNQLFVALTRSKGWVTLSGVADDYSFYEEVEKVLKSGDTFTFINKPSQHNISHEEIEIAEEDDSN